MTYWLMKSEPNTFSIDDLANRPKQTERWDGVRNYQARNMMRDQMTIGDLIFFYHSSCKIPAIVGIVTVASESYPDPTQFDPHSDYYDPKATPDKPIWMLVDIQLVKKFITPITLTQLRNEPQLEDLIVLRKGNRLSIMPVDERHWQHILSMVKQSETTSAAH